MQDDVRRLHEMRAKGNNCAQAILQMGLEALGTENPQLIKAVTALGRGCSRPACSAAR